MDEDDCLELQSCKDYEVRNDLDQCVEILRNGALLYAVENQLGPLQ